MSMELMAGNYKAMKLEFWIMQMQQLFQVKEMNNILR